MLGKTFKGMTDELLAWQTEYFPTLETRRNQWAVYLRPELVVEYTPIPEPAALSLLGSVFLSATANGIAIFMLFGAGLAAGLLGQAQALLEHRPLAGLPPRVAGAWCVAAAHGLVVDDEFYDRLMDADRRLPILGLFNTDPAVEMNATPGPILNPCPAVFARARQSTRRII